jgi:hypothetical protein
MSDGGVLVHMVTSGTFLLVRPSVLPQNDTHFENHFCLYRGGKFRGVDDLAIFGMYHFIIAPFHMMISAAILAITFDNIIKSLTCWYL